MEKDIFNSLLYLKMEDPRVEVWIASVCRGNRSLKFLHSAITSAIRLKFQKIRVSIHTDQDLTELSQKFGESLVIYRQSQPLAQFDNLAFLASISELQDKDWIIFLDDDDLLLENIKDKLEKDINGFVGWQYIGVTHDDKILAGQEDLDSENIVTFINQQNDILQADDFSGTAIRFEYFREYLQNHRPRKVTRMLEDVRFMDFIEKKLPNAKSFKDRRPFVFHRIKAGPSIWREEVLKVIDSLS